MMCSGKGSAQWKENRNLTTGQVSGNAGTLRLHLNEVLWHFRPACRTPTVETRHVEADCAGYDDDETPIMTAINMQRMHPANSAIMREGIWIKISNSTPAGYAHGGKTPFYSYLREV